MYLERRYRKFYACHDIPADVQAALGEDGKSRRRFVKSLDTENRDTAKVRAAVFEAQWRAAIERARKGSDAESDALWWREALKRVTPDQRGIATDQMIEAAHDAAGEIWGDPEAESNPKVQRFVAIATGDLIKLDEHVDEYFGTLKGKVEAKTADMARSGITKFCAEFPYVADVTRKAVQLWVNRQDHEGKAAATIRRGLGELRGYWRYLQSIEEAPDGISPFDKLTPPSRDKATKEHERQPFATADVLKLLAEARSRKDAPLADLIELAMWTGARIEELCALKVEKVNLKGGYFEITDAKTEAGWRQVPIHSKLKPTIARLVKNGRHGRTILGQTPNRYGDRAGAIGKRFGYMKRALGFGEQHVFHSIRKTVATLMENAGIAEGIAADILGHEKTTITYGLYSGGTSLKNKQAAIEKLDYGRGHPVNRR